jgi:hypothetical protein
MPGHEIDPDRRLAFAIPPIPDAGQYTQWLDPGDPDERALLISAAHPELDTDAETMLVDGREMNPRLHLAIHEIIASQLVDDEPPEGMGDGAAPAPTRLRAARDPAHARRCHDPAAVHCTTSAHTTPTSIAPRSTHCRSHGSARGAAARLHPPRALRTRPTRRNGARPSARHAAATGVAERRSRSPRRGGCTT